MATAGIYWCLVLIGCISLVVSDIPSLLRTIPTPPVCPGKFVCPGGRLVFTCTASTNGLVVWRGDSGTARTIASNGNPITVDSYNVTAALVNGVTVSYATNESVPVQLNGTMIGCSIDVGSTYTVATVTIADIPDAVNNIKIGLINNNGLLITWNTPSDPCIDHYTVTINSNNTHNESRTTNNTNITINDLVIGTNYSFIIIPIDTIGREGPPSSLIQYIWNVPAQVVNTGYQVSTDSITIWWNNTEDYSIVPVPPTQYYIISVYNTSNSIIYTNNTTNTVITITGLPLTDTNYTVSIIPVNVIGYGPSATVNVSCRLTFIITSSLPSSVSLSMTTINMMSTRSTSEFTIHDTYSTLLPKFSSITKSTISSSVGSYSSCITTTIPPPTGSIISVAIAVPITGLLTGLITSIITSIIVYCIMKNKGNKQQQGEGAATYDLPIIDKQQQQDINTHTNTAYGHVNY